MPRRDDIEKIMLIGSGPIVIGQAAEFDYSGVQACKVLIEDGYEVVLVNSNPATIMTDPEFAHRTYVEPLLPGHVARIIERERPDALLPTLGGQTALNLAKALHDDGTLERFGVELIGADYDAIHRAEDREAFRETMEAAGLRVPWSTIVESVGGVEKGLASGEISLPAIVRPAFTLGGQGGGVGHTETELLGVVSEGLAASPINQVLVEESVLGWGEFELEVMRDRNDNVVVICSIENVDPMGVHTGDSVTVAPAQTLTDPLYQELRDQALRVIRAVGVETGGSNVQFGVNPERRRDRDHRDEPAGLALLGARVEGDRLPDREDRRQARGRLRARGDRQRHHRDHAGVVRADDRLRRHEGAAVRVREVPGRRGRADDAHEVGRRGDGDRPDLPRVVREGDALARAGFRTRHPERRAGAPADARDAARRPLRSHPRGIPPRRAGRGGQRADLDRHLVPARAAAAGVDGDGTEGHQRTFLSVDTCAAEFEARTPYYYSGHERKAPLPGEVRRGDRESVVILGSGPNRIGQGIEFDYCCVHAAMTVRESGRDAVMINCNPETVSTDYDTSDRLYFEPLTAEDVLAVLEVEKPLGVIVQFGGQTPLRLAKELQDAGVPLLGTPVDAIDLAEDRGRFGALLRRLEIAHPPYGTAHSAEEAAMIAKDVGFPLLARPSYVLGGRAMEICYSEEGLTDYLERHARADRAHPLLLDRFLEDAIEVDVDALCDGETCEVAAIMQHVEEAGVHSGDSACVIPPMSLGAEMLGEIEATTRRLALELGVIGLINIQYAVAGGKLYVIEANPRASRTVPFVSKAIGAPLAKIACRLMLGEPLSGIELPSMNNGHVSVKEAVLPFARFAGADTVLGPGDEVDRRGDGRRRRLPDRVRQGAGGRRGRAARRRHRVHHGHRRRQGRGDPARRPAHRPRLRRDRDPRDGAGDLADGDTGAGDQQDRRGLAARRRLHPQRRGRARHQHADRQRRPLRRLRDQKRRGPRGDPVPDDDDRCLRRRPRDRRRRRAARASRSRCRSSTSGSAAAARSRRREATKAPE